MWKTAVAIVMLACAIAGAVVYSAWLSGEPPEGLLSRCPIRPDTRIVIYGGVGVDWMSKGWITHFFEWWESYDPAVRYVFLNSSNLRSDCDLSGYANVGLYVQPGGDAYDQQSSLGSAGRRNILNFLGKGGAYLGICAGWYYAAKDYYWQGDYYDYPNLLGKYPTVEGSITEIAVYPAYSVTRMSNGLEMVYYGGPTRGWRQTPHDPSGTALMTFANIPGNLSAAVRSDKMLLISTHPEAFEDYGITELTTKQRIANYRWLANAVSDVAGMHFRAPQSSLNSRFGSLKHKYGLTQEWGLGGAFKVLIFRFQAVPLVAVAAYVTTVSRLPFPIRAHLDR
jgi:hypothetical protein